MGRLIKCKSCGTEIAKSAETCPKCGAKYVHEDLISKLFFWLFVVPLCLSIIGAIIF